jgi:hypothetical protein
MTCRHEDGDPRCTTRSRTKAPITPDAENYEIEQVERVGNNLVMKVKYPNCANCSFEGKKVMVFLNVTEEQALKWKKIDPHFRDSQGLPPSLKEAPSPAARFPASTDGWCDALSYARGHEKD